MIDYQAELFAQKTPYLQWLMSHGVVRQNSASDMERQICVCPFFSGEDIVCDIIGGKADEGKIYLFANKDGVLCDGAKAEFAAAFCENPLALAAYADEDYYGSLSELYGISENDFSVDVISEYEKNSQGLYRGEPWFKPDFSPDTLDSFFYIGNIFAVRGEVISDITDEKGSGITVCELMRDLSHRALRESEADGKDKLISHGADRFVHIKEVLYTNNSLAKRDELEGLRICEDKPRNFGRVSVIILSKDNPLVLEKCIVSFEQSIGKSLDYEIIVVDNGSSDENKKRVQNFVLSRGGKYIYEKMDFNFSRLCNIGAATASGEFYLFMNDDIECPLGCGNGWICKMLSYAVKTHVGAVGIKLRYPDEITLQHTGITNMGIGPAHKLCGMADSESLYHGHNAVDYDMLAVTAACMLLSAEKWHVAGGFDEELAVAYNDVELCFRLYKMGLYNVQVNSTFLLHHESLSRGSDEEGKKRKRRIEEMNMLYNKHPWAKGQDPFYSPYLVQWEKDAGYNINYQYAYAQMVKPVLASQSKLRKLIRQENHARMAKRAGSFAQRLYNKLTGAGRQRLTIESVEGIEENGAADIIKITGWHIMTGKDNSSFDKSILLYNDKSMYEARLYLKLREDVAAVFENDQRTLNVSLAGIEARLDMSNVEMGSYSLAIRAAYGNDWNDQKARKTLFFGIKYVKVKGHSSFYVRNDTVNIEHIRRG